MVAFNDRYNIIDVIPVSGAGDIAHTIANAAAVDKFEGVVNLTLTAAHDLAVGSVVYIEGTTNYNGLREIVAVPETDEINIKARYVAETPAGTETVKIALTSKKDFKFLGFRLNNAVAPGQADIMTITIDSGKGAAWDTVIYSNDLDAVTDLEYINPNVDLPFDKNDVLRVAWPNVANRTFGIEFFIAPLN
jgi:hypothetical protein